MSHILKFFRLNTPIWVLLLKSSYRCRVVSYSCGFIFFFLTHFLLIKKKNMEPMGSLRSFPGCCAFSTRPHLYPTPTHVRVPDDPYCRLVSTRNNPFVAEVPLPLSSLRDIFEVIYTLLVLSRTPGKLNRTHVANKRLVRFFPSFFLLLLISYVERVIGSVGEIVPYAAYTLNENLG